MTWFKRSAQPTVRVPFALERVSALKPIFEGAIERAIKLRQGPQVTYEDVERSAFLNAYVCGYCHHLDQQSDALGAAIRGPLLALIFMASDVEAEARFALFRLLYERKDETVTSASHLAASDGSFYFSALMRGEDADERSVANLVISVRLQPGFDPLVFPH